MTKGKTTTTKKPADKTYSIAGKELPLTVDLPGGEQLVYKKAGEKFKGADWPSPHTTIPGALKAGLIEEVN